MSKLQCFRCRSHFGKDAIIYRTYENYPLCRYCMEEYIEEQFFEIESDLDFLAEYNYKFKPYRDSIKLKYCPKCDEGAWFDKNITKYYCQSCYHEWKEDTK